MRTGIVAKSNLAVSNILSPEYVDDKKDIGTQEQTFALDFLYEKTDEGGLKTIDLCLEC